MSNKKSSYLRDSFIRWFISGYLLQQLPHSPLFVLFPLTFHVLLTDLGQNEFGDLDKRMMQTERDTFTLNNTIHHSPKKEKQTETNALFV